MLFYNNWFIMRMILQWNWGILFNCILLLLPNGVLSLELIGMDLPYYGIVHRSATLECHFHLGNDTLYTLKWYKDGHEFFRFNPNDFNNIPITIFPLVGVTVNVNLSSLHRVHLEPITILSRGEYRCEISADAPSFKTVYKDQIMKVMILPHRGPKIYGIFPWYNIGDNFTSNCSVKKSSPQTKLTWFLNDEMVKPDICNCIISTEIIESGSTGDGIQFYNTFTHLYFQLDMNYFKDGTLKIECRATFNKSNVILKDIITSNIKEGLGLQYNMHDTSYSRGGGKIIGDNIILWNIKFKIIIIWIILLIIII